MPGLGTLINMVAIVVGGLAGMFVGERMSTHMREALLKANGVVVLFIGISGAVAGMLTESGGTFGTQHTMLVVVCIVLGTLIGEAFGFDAWVTRFGEWLKAKTGNASDVSFVDGFVTASMTVAVGAMAVVGAVDDALLGDISVLCTKAILDCVIVLSMACTLGRGCVFSALSVGAVQGSVTALALLAGPFFTDTALAYLSLVGSVVIFCVGVNLVWGNRIAVLNMLPALVLAPLCAYLPIVL